MVHFIERKEIEILMMVGYGVRNHEEVSALFNQQHPDGPPIARSTACRILGKFSVHGTVSDLARRDTARH